MFCFCPNKLHLKSSWTHFLDCVNFKYWIAVLYVYIIVRQYVLPRYIQFVLINMEIHWKYLTSLPPPSWDGSARFGERIRIWGLNWAFTISVNWRVHRSSLHFIYPRCLKTVGLTKIFAENVIIHSFLLSAMHLVC